MSTASLPSRHCADGRDVGWAVIQGGNAGSCVVLRFAGGVVPNSVVSLRSPCPAHISDKNANPLRAAPRRIADPTAPRSTSPPPAAATTAKPQRKAPPAKPATSQPFKIGKFSRVVKRSAADLAFSDDESLSEPSTISKAWAKGKGKGKARTAGKAKKLPTPSASEESDFEPKDDGDFAMDSEEEAAQLKKAIEVSTGKATKGAGKGKGKGKGKVELVEEAKPAKGKGKKVGGFQTAGQVLGSSSPASGASTPRRTAARAAARE